MSEEKCKYEKINDYKSAFECFKQRFLEGEKSIFRLDSDEEILNQQSIKYLINNFVNKGLEGNNVSFIDKIKLQLLGKNKINGQELKIEIKYPNNISDENQKKQIQKNAIEVLAHCAWLWRLVPYNANMQSTIKSVKEILDLHEDLKSIKLNTNSFFNSNIKGIASTGTYYNTNKPFELAFVINFLDKYLKQNQDKKSEINILNELCKKSIIQTYGEIVKKDKKSDFVESEKKEKHTKTASIANALLFFFKQDEYEPIVSNNHKESIVDNLRYLIDDKCKGAEEINDEGCKQEIEIDLKIKCIKDKLLENDEYKSFEDSSKFFYEEPIEELWNPSILPGKNIIYYGAPGTGKTYSVKKIVEAKVKAQCGKNECAEDYYEIVQFHPSYTYEDFIDGVKPIGIQNGQMQFELKNGVFKQMCIDAFKELANAKQNNREPKKFYFIADEINRAELSRVFGELLLCLEEDKRLSYKNGKLTGVKLKTQNSNLWEEENAVVVINNNKCSNKKELYFGVPENLYFIGTMNDIDKSIDSFDMALRRRFKWIQKTCNYDVIYNELLGKGVDDNDIDIYVTDRKAGKGRCNLLNKYITNTLNLGSSYELGHSYFMNITEYINALKNKQNNKTINIPKTAYENLFDQELAPLLKEYLRSEISDPKELEKQLKCMKIIFVDGEKCK